MNIELHEDHNSSQSIKIPRRPSVIVGNNLLRY